jgi:mannose-1-phosphate guanylyltransferase
VGSRFWPRSREKTPKQLLRILKGGTMIQETVNRLDGLVAPSNTIVVTNKTQKPLVVKQLPQLPAENVLVEPIGRNTAPCIGLAALYIRRADPDAVMVVLPADHLMENEEEFRRVLGLAIWVAYESGKLITIGIAPTRPETGYGYIQLIDDDDDSNPYLSRGVYKVKTFAEKPNRETAQRFLASGDFLWNSGMFVWKADVILKEIARSLPELSAELGKIEAAIGSDYAEQAIETGYRTIRGISIDYGVMEKASEVYVLRGDFGWSDVGSWDEVYRVSGKDADGNSVTGKAMLHNTKNSLVFSDEKIVAAVDVEDLIIIVTGDAVLVCKRGASQDVKEVVDYLRRKQMNEFL